MLGLVLGLWIGFSLGALAGVWWAHLCNQRRQRERMVRDIMAMVRIASKVERVTPRAARQFVRDQLIEGVWAS